MWRRRVALTSHPHSVQCLRLKDAKCNGLTTIELELAEMLSLAGNLQTDHFGNNYDTC